MRHVVGAYSSTLFADANESVFWESYTGIVRDYPGYPVHKSFLKTKRKDFRLAPEREKGVMISSFKEKSVILIVTSLVISMLLLWGIPSTVFAASRQATVSMSPKGATSSLAGTYNTTKNSDGYTPSKSSNGKNYQVNSQYKQSNSSNSNNSYYSGSHQGNSGNSGYNWGFNQDNGSNSGNQVSNNRHTFGNQINTQVIGSNGPGGNNNNNSYYWGVDQGNSGNEGYNWGYNQNNSSNSGNQINN
ncbi:hypothetical protein [Ktedonobacter racemifer]|uniref:Uncharacterized protein n=1 Tax=Ktedonobacter racemifer DSM 44963 TaxID=485913 RepID=D6TE88_KTERA|nr:hypothetical protein [Ktedonobacter racemifer]EFH88461.1 hypothetical protein Krac_9932 [Ktedonobacter racemifer DSM 44963]